MSKTLIIAEKPSVATDLSRVLAKELGKFEKKKDYFENDKAIISSAIGHLVELKMPTTADGKKLPWGFNHLPHIPDRFELQPIERNESRLKLLIRLMKKKEVTEIINACDAGREGELIFRYLIDMAGVKDKKIKRLWMQSMTNQSILDAYQKLRDDSEMLPLADAAICRSESDWLIGLNGTRALTAYNSRNGGFNVTTAGRVQTPTLAILAEREVEIRNFVPEGYFEVHGDFKVEAGNYAGRWFREGFKKDPEKEHGRAERIWTVEEANAIRERCEGKEGIVEEVKKPSKQAAPQLYDLTSLQREAGSRFGFSAKRTLQLAQALYDRYKLLTYPRTDSRYLPEDYIKTVEEHMGEFERAKPNAAFPKEICGFAGNILKNKRITNSKRIFNNAKISDHFAIIPTGKIPAGGLEEPAQKLYDHVLRRFLAVFYPAAEFENTNRITRIGQDAFKTDGKILIVPGWLEVYGRKPGVPDGKDELVPAKDGEKSLAVAVEVQEKVTKPPARYSESTLLSAMETAGKRVDDDELREAMSERGLGTPATRAATIEGLINQKYIERNEQNKRELITTNKGIALIQQLQDIGLEVLGSPEMTGDWEFKLKQMEHGELDRDTFMSEIKSVTEKLVRRTQDYTQELIAKQYPDIKVPCPICHADSLKQTDGTYECHDTTCKFRTKKFVASHQITEAEAKDLFTKGATDYITNFKSRFGQDFTAALVLTDDFKVTFKFEGDDEKAKELDNLSDEQVICKIPNPETGEEVKIYETDAAYLAPELAKKKSATGIRISKTLLEQEISTEQAKKLFTEGKTDLLTDFVSKKKGKRKFSAFLKLNLETGKIDWEFPPRAKKAAKKKSAKKKTANANEGAE